MTTNDTTPTGPYDYGAMVIAYKAGYLAAYEPVDPDARDAITSETDLPNAVRMALDTDAHAWVRDLHTRRSANLSDDRLPGDDDPTIARARTRFLAARQNIADYLRDKADEIERHTLRYRPDGVFPVSDEQYLSTAIIRDVQNTMGNVDLADLLRAANDAAEARAEWARKADG